MELLVLTLANGLGYGMLLFMLSSGLTLVFSLMGVLNFAHASIYMLGAYLGYALHSTWGFGAAGVLAPLLVGLLGAALEYGVLRRVHRHGHVPELLLTFGFSYLLIEIIQLVWGRSPLPALAPAWFGEPLVTVVRDTASGAVAAAWGPNGRLACHAGTACASVPLSRGLVVLVALGMLAAMALLLRWSRIGLVIRAAKTHPGMARALGHNVDAVYALVFGAGSALAALAGVLGGSIFVTEPGMAASVGPLLFVVVVVGGLGSLSGAFVASVLLGLLQTAAVTVPGTVAGLPLSQIAPVLPYALLVLVLLLRPQGLAGTEEAV